MYEYPGKVTRAISDHSTYFELRSKKYNPNCVRVKPLWNISNCIFRERLKSIFFNLAGRVVPARDPNGILPLAKGHIFSSWRETEKRREVTKWGGRWVWAAWTISSDPLQDWRTHPLRTLRPILRDVLSGIVPNSFKKRSSFVLRLFCSVYICIVELP